jgi:Polysaccharide pyruvyl transferase
MPKFRIITNKRVCFWGAPADVPSGPATIATRIQQTGYNTGNLLIGHGLFHGTEAQTKAYHPGFGQMSPQQFDEYFDVVFVPSSNFVRNGIDLKAQYDYFSKTKASFFVFGLGSQVKIGEPVQLEPGTDRFLRLAAERSGSLGVRGAGTAELLLSMGIRNIDIIGCPSLLEFPGHIKARPSGTIGPGKRIAVNYSSNVRSHSFAPEMLAALEGALFRRLLKCESYYILQNEEPEIEILNFMGKGIDANKFPISETSIREALRRIARLFSVDVDDNDVRRFLTHNMRIFFKVEEWRTCMQTMDFAIGSRFHGNVAALLAGVPALFLAHDNRTLELCEFFGFPHVRIDPEFTVVPIEELLQLADYGSFISRFHTVHAQWKTFVARNNMEFSATI